jgi:hypothetical protein
MIEVDYCDRAVGNAGHLRLGHSFSRGDEKRQSGRWYRPFGERRKDDRLGRGG